MVVRVILPLFFAGEEPLAGFGAQLCPGDSGWDETTWPVLVAKDGRHLIRALHIYSDATIESHGREVLLPTEVTQAPNEDGLP
jgi:hypothetical protein